MTSWLRDSGAVSSLVGSVFGRGENCGQCTRQHCLGFRWVLNCSRLDGTGHMFYLTETQLEVGFPCGLACLTLSSFLSLDFFLIFRSWEVRPQVSPWQFSLECCNVSLGSVLVELRLGEVTACVSKQAFKSQAVIPPPSPHPIFSAFCFHIKASRA